MQQTARRRNVPSALSLEQALRRLGYRPGFPPRLLPAARFADLSIPRRMRCPGCDRRGMGARPYHKAESPGYRIVAVCPDCGAGEEL